MMKGIHTNIIIYWAAVASLLAGCVKEDTGGGDRADGDEIEYTFPFTVPNWYSPTVTRTFTVPDDQVVRDVYILAYVWDDESGKELFSYYKPALSIDYAGNGRGTFTLRLARSQAGEKYSFDILANMSTNDVSTAVKTLVIGEDREDVRKKVCRTAGNISANSMTAIWCWAYVAPTELDRDTNLGPVKFIAAAARIDVGLNWPSDDGPAAGLPNFKLETFYMANYANGAYFIPDPDNYDPVLGKVTAPTPWPSNQNQDHVLKNPIDDDFIIRTGYIFEQDVYRVLASKSFCFLMRGTLYDSDGTSLGTRYFPLRLMDPEDPTQRLVFLRSHRYRINITGVHGEGFLTLSEATRPENIDEYTVTYDLHISEGGDINHVVYSNTNFLGISNISETFDTDGGTGQIKVRTDVAGGWAVRFEDENGAAPTWLSISGSTSGAANSTGTVTYSVDVNSGDYSPRSAFARFSAGQLEISTLIHQSGDWFIKTDHNPMNLIRGDGDQFEVSVWGDVPGEVLVRAYSPQFEEYVTRLYIQGDINELPVSPAISMDTIRFTSLAAVPETSPIKDNLRIVANAMVTNIIREVHFQYSIDGGTSWVMFEDGRQGKGHFYLPLDTDVKGNTGRMVALYNMPETYYWAQAMGIDPFYNDVYFYTWNPLAYTGIDGSEATLYWRSNYGYTPTEPTGCNDYYEEDYPEFERGKWRLPSRDELWVIKDFHLHIGDVPLGGFYWSSSEDTGGPSYSSNSYGLRLREDGQKQSDYQYKGSWYNQVRCVYGEPVTVPPPNP